MFSFMSHYHDQPGLRPNSGDQDARYSASTIEDVCAWDVSTTNRECQLQNIPADEVDFLALGGSAQNPADLTAHVLFV